MSPWVDVDFGDVFYATMLSYLSFHCNLANTDCFVKVKTDLQRPYIQVFNCCSAMTEALLRSKMGPPPKKSQKVGCPTNHWMQPVESSAHWRPFGMLLHCVYCVCTNFKSLMAKQHTLNIRMRHRSRNSGVLFVVQPSILSITINYFKAHT